ncbi:Dcm Site-specific DNA methylase [Candidatus Nanopelagicaceae bacterium]
MARVTSDSQVTVHDAALLIGVSPDTIRRWHKKGLIKAKMGAGGERLFSSDEISRVIAKTSSSDNPWRVLKASKSKLNSIELFAGAGGLALGMHNAGIQSKLLVDFDKDSVATLKTNMPHWNAHCDSVTDIDLDDYRGQIDVMAGGFPCQAFSYAGKSRGFADTRGTLFYEYARLIDQVKPQLVLGENVKGLLNHDEGRTLSVIVQELENLGYRVAFKVLRAQFLDVPQKRERLIIFGLRKDLKSDLLFPVEKDYTIDLRAALKDVPKSEGQSYSESKSRIMELIPEGGYWRDLPDALQRKYMGGSYHLGGGKTGMARRLAWDEPSLTLTCNPAQKQTERCHPKETRPLTVREYARIQTFPDNWEFVGSASSQYRQIGNAVPVNLGYHVGLAIRAILGQSANKSELPSKLAAI